MNKISRWNPKLEHQGGPKYLAVLDALARDIRNGTLAPGDQLPPQRRVAEHFGVTISTITKVFAEASRMGLVETTRGSGTFIASSRPVSQASIDFIEMGINLIPHKLCEEELTAGMREYVQTTAASDMFGYVGYQLCLGSPGRHFAGWLTDRHFSADGGVLFMCNGTQQGLLAAMQCLSSPGETVLCEAQTFTGILRIAHQQNLVAHGIQIDDEGVCPDALERGLVETDAKLVVLTPTAQNPTGATMSDDRRRRIATLIRKYKAFLIEDAVTTPLADAGLSPVASHSPQNSIYLTGASKCVASGVRFGAMRVPESLAETMNEALLASNWTGPSHFAGFADLLLRSGRMNRILSIYQSDVVRRQELVRRYLGWIPKSEFAYHCWHELPSSIPAQSLAAQAMGANLHLSTAVPLSCPNVTPPNALRLCLGAETDVSTLEIGLARLARLLAKARPLAAPII